MNVLEVKSVAAGYSGSTVIRNVSVEVPPGQVRVILGANGAGKSTLLRAISGLIPIVSGEIIWNGKTLKGKQPYQISALGISHCLEGRRVFPFLNVKDNLEVGAYLSNGQTTREMMQRVFEIFPVLKTKIKQKANTLSGGERQMLCVGQTLMSNPKILLLDEPSAGLSPKLVEDLANSIHRISEQGTGVLWAEQNARIALDASDFAYLLSLGNIVFAGDSQQVKKKEIIKTAYLGV